MLHEIMSTLYAMNIQSIVIEGGNKLLQSFINEGLWDEARIITNAKMIIGDGINAPELKEYSLNKSNRYFDDTITYLKRFMNDS